MSEILSTWKEVAQYFGKGVRTVQRWERTAGLPIHRPVEGAILAHRSELGEWLRKNERSRLDVKRDGGSSLQSARVLIIDDERLIADTLKIILERSGYEVAVAYDGEEGFARSHSFRPDIVLADYDMPKLNGIEACIQIKQLLPACRIMMLSGHSLAQEIGRYPKGYDFLLMSKPMHPDELLQAFAAERIESSTRRRFHILNVDDIEPHRYSLSRLLTRGGFEVSEAATGADALRLAIECKPDLILLDIHLPDRDGFDVCATLKQHPDTARITIVHVTSSAIEPESARRSRLAGADDYIPYPIAPSSLLQRTRDLLQRRILKEFAS